MRVIAGSLRGRPISAPKGTVTRPTSDRVRESVFNILVNLTDLEGASVLDLFAGSGAFGIEAISRGARDAVFVDNNSDAVAAIRRNLAALGLSDRGVEQREVGTWLASASDRTFDVAFCDPPYSFDGWPGVFAHLHCGLAVMESKMDIEPPAGWDLVRSRRYGTTLVTIVRPVSHTERGEE